MGLLAEIFFHKNPNQCNNKKLSHVFYKIIDSNQDGNYTLHCINTSAIFHAKITEIIFDADILYRLHPIQACYIGIEYARYAQKNQSHLISNNHTMKSYLINEDDNYTLRYQNRSQEICFVNNKTNIEYTLDPRDIAISREFIGKFNPDQAFYVGLLAGLKLNAISKKYQKNLEIRYPYLRLVK